MRRPHTYSRSTLDAAAMLGLQIATARRERRWAIADLADRAGISLNTLRNAERGVPTVAVGVMFELATLLGIPLFNAEPTQLPSMLTRQREQLALLPSYIRAPTTPVDDNF